MAAMSRGKSHGVQTAKKPKGGTPSSRKHHFESFSQRIAKLKIDPVRRGRNTILDNTELDTSFSYFKTSLEQWRDINTSKNFTTFARQAAPLCESMPQLLHHGDRVFDLLVQYIGEGDTLGEEPLLDLMAHFAHDLGTRFEKYFEQAVKTVSQLAVKCQDAEVIEWSFTCLAWLFKYLSRLLVPDLRPTFDLMSPLLGKEHQKPFVTRFAAEALSFLVRKAAASYHRNQEPLKLIMVHLSQQLKGSMADSNAGQYRHGIMALFVDSIKGVQRGLHSCATSILQELLIQTYVDYDIGTAGFPLESIVHGTVIAVIHYTDSETFKPVLEVVLKQIRSSAPNPESIGLSSRLIFTVAGVRKGSRIADWQPLLEILVPLLENMDQSTHPSVADMDDLLACAAVLFQYCPLNVAISHVQLLEAFTRDNWEQRFLFFCNYFADIGAERFKSLLLPYFKRFVMSKADNHGDELCLILSCLHQIGAIHESSIPMPSKWGDYVVGLFQSLNPQSLSENCADRAVFAANAFLDASHVLVLDSGVKDKIVSFLQDLLQHAANKTPDQSPSPLDIFGAGKGFLYLIHHGSMNINNQELWPRICQASLRYGLMLPFWQSLLVLVKRMGTGFAYQSAQAKTLKKSLLRCIGSPSHELRVVALEILEVVAAGNSNTENAISTALMIEQTPMDIQNARAVSMRIRKLATTYKEVCTNDWLNDAIPIFLFGLLHVRLSQVWDDVCIALKEVCESREGESIVSQIAFHWMSLDDARFEPELSKKQKPVDTRRYPSEFECTNLWNLTDMKSSESNSLQSISDSAKDLFDSHHCFIPSMTIFNRTQALRVLNAVPHIAEKRSRNVVPILLRWTSDLDHQELEPEKSDNIGADQEIPGTSLSGWTRKDQKAMLSLFSKFVNPKVLFKSDEAYSALITLLENGDAEIQKSTLKAILTWKDSIIARYQENLFNLLDDARFREEISVFMDISEEDSHLREEDRHRLLPIILRLLYGKIISGRRGQEAKRKAVFIALTRFDENAIKQFLSIACGPLNEAKVVNACRLDESLLATEPISLRKQVGLLNMLEAMLTTLKSTIAPFTENIIDPLLFCLIKASRALINYSETDLKEADSKVAHLSLLRAIRQRGFHSLNLLFENCVEFDWNPYIPLIVDELVLPKLAHFASETAQSVSGLLRLFSAWTRSPRTVNFLVDYNAEILVRCIDILELSYAKDEVKLFVLDKVLRETIRLVSNDDSLTPADNIQRNQIQTRIIQPYARSILLGVGALLQTSPSKDLLESAVHTVAELAPHVTGSTECQSMIEISILLLRQPSQRVSTHTKRGLMRILHGFVPRCNADTMDELMKPVLDVTCSLFNFFRDAASRDLLCDIIQDLAEHQENLHDVAMLCRDLNSFSVSKLDEPDFDRRSKAFNSINDDATLSLSSQQWRPLIYNMLYYIKDSEELSIRINASFSLRRFVEKAAKDESSMDLLSSVVLPELQNTMREDSELVRAEALTVLAHIIKMYPDWSPISDMHVLLSSDEESSFFSNVLHIQLHRRLRALRRLASHSSKLKSGNICHIILPLLEHFIFNKSEDENAHNLAGETILTIGALADWLEWPQYRSLLKRYVGYLTVKEDMQKTVVKLLVSLMGSISRAGEMKGYVTPNSLTEIQKTKIATTLDINRPMMTLARTLPSQEKLTSDFAAGVLPKLSEYLHKKDESTVSLRVPIAVGLTKILLVLPPKEIEGRLPSLLLDICHILKSKSQDARDMARNTLADIAALLGPNYLAFILNSLRTALQRGYQLHVLSFTLHHILIKLDAIQQPGQFDYCLPDIVAVIMDDIFGITGQEKDAEEYISNMKEVKSSKSYDSMDIIARVATPSHLADLIWPIKSLLLERMNVRIVLKVDELLRRIGLGILQNATINNRDILVFCYELIQEASKDSDNVTQGPKEDLRNKRYLVNLKDPNKPSSRGSTSSYSYKITRFGLDILRTVLRRHDELLTPQNLLGFLPIMGDSLVQGQEEVQISAIRLLTTIVKVPLPTLDQDCLVYVSEAVRNVKAAPSTSSELAQASLKMISAVLRDRPNVAVKDRDLGSLLKRMLPDIDEPDRQGVIFGFLKAIMNRKIIITEVYEIMDKVAVMMVTNQTRSTRDLARSTYFYFLIEYPQAKNRFTKQLEFLIRNLRYDHVEGRQSVMEALNLILTKVGDTVLQDALGMMFIPLIQSMANDDSSDCRIMAGALVKKIFERADKEKTKDFLSDLRGWLEQNENQGLKRLSIQCWGLYLEVTEGQSKEQPYVIPHLQRIINECTERRNAADWELIYYALIVFLKLCKLSQNSIFSNDMEDLWRAIRSSTSYPHIWVKITAAKLMGFYFADFSNANGADGLHNLPLKGSGGLQLDGEEMLRLTSQFSKNLYIPDVTEELCLHSIRNLAFLARCLAVNDLKSTRQVTRVDNNSNANEDVYAEDIDGKAASEKEDEWGGLSNSSEPSEQTAIHQLVIRLSAIIRRETRIMKLSSLFPKTAVMSLLETLCSKLPIESLDSSLHHLLTTLHTITDPATTIPRSSDQAFNDTYKALIDKAQEIMDIVQKRVGSKEYVAIIRGVQKGVRKRREDRRTKRKVEAVTMPEKFGKEKRRRQEVKKVKKKERKTDSKGKRRGW